MAPQGAHFLVLGAGGLGAPALLALLAGGARSLTIVDRDRVDATNLHRQVLYDLGDVGALKSEAARLQLLRRDRQLCVDALTMDLDASALDRLLEAQPAGAIVLECSDSPDLKFMVNDACLRRDLAAVIGGVIRWRGQAQAIARGAACLRCVYEDPPPHAIAEQCAAVGVLGPAAGLFGHLMAHLAFTLARARGEIAGALLTFDLLQMRPQELRPRPRAGCPACAGHDASSTVTPSHPACSSRTIPAPR